MNSEVKISLSAMSLSIGGIESLGIIFCKHKQLLVIILTHKFHYECL